MLSHTMCPTMHTPLYLMTSAERLTSHIYEFQNCAERPLLPPAALGELALAASISV